MSRNQIFCTVYTWLQFISRFLHWRRLVLRQWLFYSICLGFKQQSLLTSVPCNTALCRRTKRCISRCASHITILLADHPSQCDFGIRNPSPTPLLETRAIAWLAIFVDLTAVRRLIIIIFMLKPWRIPVVAWVTGWSCLVRSLEIDTSSYLPLRGVTSVYNYLLVFTRAVP